MRPGIAEVSAPLGFVPPHFGVLIFLERYKGQTQQQIADAVGANRNTMVAIIDDLERLGLAQRQPHPSDRRANAVHLTKQGRTTLQKARQLAAQFEQDFTAELDPAERETLVLLLRRLADREGLSRGVHPGLAKNVFGKGLGGMGGSPGPSSRWGCQVGVPGVVP